jgi:hypothetical protein
LKVRGKIVAFDRSTWWGEAQYDLTIVEFHGTSVNGMTSDTTDLIGRECDLLFNDSGRLFDVRII